jgi:hypothetical protein
MSTTQSLRHEAYDYELDEPIGHRPLDRRRGYRTLVVDDDFSWSDAPAARRRGPVAVVAAAPATVPEARLDGSHRSLETPYGIFDAQYEFDADLAERDGLDATDGRRTVVITGHGDDRTYSLARRRRQSALPVYERAGFRPDRLAMWAVLLGIVLLLVAATSGHAAVLPH